MANTVLASGYPKFSRGSEDAYGTRHRQYTYDFKPNAGYGTGGGILVSPGLFGVSLLDQIENVILSDWSTGGPSGYVFYWNAATGAIQFYITAGFTPAGSVAAPTISTVNDSGSPTYALGILTAALSVNHSALTGITGVQAPAFTGTLRSAAGLAELGNVSVSSVIVRGTFLIKP